MRNLLDNLRHQLDRSGLTEGHQPWFELNVGQDGIPRVAQRSSVEWLKPIEKLMAQHLQKASDLPPGAQFVYSALEVDKPDGAKRSVMVSVTPPHKNMTDRALGIVGLLVKKHQRSLGASPNHGVTSKKPGRGSYSL